ncbi:MAG TPA: lactonase family protein [Flavisolibacter sp.]|nr:lactonase family protein [Flavisolibacter sp.]
MKDELSSIIMRLFSFILFMFIATTVVAQKNYYLLIGTYTKGKSTGMYVYDFNKKNGSVTILDSVQTPNPSYLAVAPNQKFVYAVSETKRGDFSGKIRSFSFDKKTGQLHFINEQASVGDNPCYVIVDKTGKWVIDANYSSGTLSVLPIKSDGSLGEAVSSSQHAGHGTNAQRQEGPHVHSTVLSPDNTYLFVQDLGIDKIIIYSFNDKTGAISRKDSVKLQDGSGPRHFTFHPNGKWAYVVQEMEGTVTTFDYQNGKLKPVQTISTLPAGFNQYFTAADIHVSNDGKFLYATTRDSANIITVFKVDQKTGKLSAVGSQPVMGKTPRNFNFDPGGDYLLVANQNSDNVVIFKINHQTGMLTDTGNRIDVGSPVCIKWIEK